MFVSLPFSGVAALDAGDRARALALHPRLAHRPSRAAARPTGAWPSPAEWSTSAPSTAGWWRSTPASGAVRWDVTVAEYAGTTEATSQLGQDDPLSRVARHRLHRCRHRRGAAGLRRQGVRRHRRRRLRPPSRPGARRRRRVGPVRPAGTDGRVRRGDRPARLAVGGDGTEVGGPLRGHDRRRRAPPPRRRRRAGGRPPPPRGVALRRRLDLRHAGRGPGAAVCSSSAPATRRPRWRTPRGRATISTPRRSSRSTSGPAGSCGTTSRCRTTAGATTWPARRSCST